MANNEHDKCKTKISKKSRRGHKRKLNKRRTKSDDDSSGRAEN